MSSNGGSSSSSEQTRPLYYWPPGADLTATKEAFLSLSPGFKVIPYEFDSAHVGRVLCLEPGFPWIHDHAPAWKGGLVDALKWTLGLEDFERGPVLILDQLKSIFGDGLREVTDGPENQD